MKYKEYIIFSSEYVLVANTGISARYSEDGSKRIGMIIQFLRDNNLLTYIPSQYTGDNNSDIDKHILELQQFKFY